MYVVLIFGRKVAARALCERPFFCGACVDVTAHVVSRLDAHDHVYFIPISSGSFAGVVASCRKCGTVVSYDDQDADRVEDEGDGGRADPWAGYTPDRRRGVMLARFVDAHGLVAERAGKSWLVTAVGLVLFFLWAGASIAAGFALGFGWPLAVTVGVLFAIFVGGSIAAARTLADRALRPVLPDRLRRILEATGRAFADVEALARHARYRDLARHLRSPRYASMRPPR